MSDKNYLIKFEEDGSRGITYAKDIHYQIVEPKPIIEIDGEGHETIIGYTEEKIINLSSDFDYEKLLEEGFEWVSTDDYNKLLGNFDGQEYIKVDDEFVQRPPHVPTEQELTQQKALETKSKLSEQKDVLLMEMLKGNDTAPVVANYSIMLMSIDDKIAKEIPEMFPAWNGNSKQYKTGDRVEFEGILYKVLQDHTSQSSWTPTAAPSLFAKVLVSDDGSPQEWQQPDSTNPYMKGDRVLFNGKTYESLIDNNVWSPEAYPNGWKEIIE